MVYSGIVPGVAEKHGKGPLRLSLANNLTGGNTQVTLRQEDDPSRAVTLQSDLEQSGSAGTTVVSSAGEIDFEVTALSGDSNLSYSWSVTILDPGSNNSLAVHTAGTTNAARYNTLRIQMEANVGFPPIDIGVILVKCTVTQDPHSTSARQTTTEMGAMVTIITAAV